jgi:hypothetical protein
MIFINYSSIPAIVAVPQVKRLLRRLEFDPYEVRVVFMVDKVIPRFFPEPCGFPWRMSFHKTTIFIQFFLGGGDIGMGPAQVTVQQRRRLMAPQANKEQFSL